MKNVTRQSGNVLVLSLCLAFLGTLIIQPEAIAQNYGRITGKVVEAQTNSPLPGANVIIEGTMLGAATDVNGRFVVLKVPPGTYTVKATFLGYQDQTQEVKVQPRQSATADFALTETVVEGEQVVVYGTVTRGQAKALQRQRSAPNIIQVVSEEFFNRFPDRNAAETVRRLPAISVSRDQGEGEMVMIRGMSEEYNSLTLNGIRIPSPDEHDGARSVGLDLINNRLLGEIEVIKAITPENDGDAVGGIVNFGLRRAPEKGIATIGIGGGYNNQVSDFDYYGRDIQDYYAIWGDRFFNNKLGILIDGAYYKTSRHSKLKELNYLNEGDVGPYSDDIYQQHTNDYDLIRQRYGYSLSADYEFNNLNRIYLLFNNNTYLDDEIRRSVEYRIEDQEEERTTRNRVEDQRLKLFMLGGEHNLGWLKVDYKGAWIPSSEELPDRTYLRYERDNPLLATVSNDEVKEYDGTTKFSGLEPLTLNRVRWDNMVHKDADRSGQINATVPFSVGTGDLSSFKFGVKILRKDVSFDRHRYEIKKFTEDVTTPDGTFGFENVRYHDPALTKYYAAEPKERGNLYESYDASETVTALYGLTRLNFSPKLTALAGVRIEDTKNDYKQPYVENPSLIVESSVSGKGGYTNVLPSAHLMYRFNDHNNLKLAYSTGLARPRYTELVPRMELDERPSNNSDLTGKISYGNPDLEPRTAYNFDLMYDRFSPYLGVISGGIFYKLFKAWHTSKTWTEQHDFVNDTGEDVPDGIPETYRARQLVMGDGTATYYGIELNFQQRLLPLSQALKWFTVNLNFTYTKSEGELEGRKVPMTRSPKYLANASLIYDNTDLGLSLVVAAHYRDPILGGLEVTDYGPDKYLDTWFDYEFFVDISAVQKITDKLLLIGQLNGLGHTQEREVLGYPRESWARTQQWERYGPYGTIGIQYVIR